MMDSGALTSGYGALWTGGVIYGGMAGMMTIYGDIYISVFFLMMIWY